LTDDNPKVRCLGAWVLQMLGPDASSARAALQDRLEDPDEHVRRWCGAALKAIDP
jgi:hypothetical protein